MKYRILSLLLALVMLTSLLAGCNSSGPEPAATDSQTVSPEPVDSPEPSKEAPPVETPLDTPDQPPEDTEPVIPDEPPEPERPTISYPIGDGSQKFTYFTDFGFFDMGLDSYNNHPRLPDITEATGVVCWFHEVSFTAKQEQFNLMIVSEDMTDVIQCGQYYIGGDGAAYSDEVIIDLTDLLPEYAPDYWEALNKTNEATVKAQYTEGRILTMRTVLNKYINDLGMITRGDWLEELGIDAPNTIDGFTDMLHAFKDNYDCDYTIIVNPDSTIQFTQSAFETNLFQVNGTAIPTQRNGSEIINCMVSDNYRNYIEWFKGLYDDGLIYSDYYTSTMSEADYFSQVGRNQVGVWNNTSGSFEAMKPYLGDNTNVVAAPLPRILGDNGKFDYEAETILTKETFNITTSCEDPSLVVMFYNWFFTPEGALLANWGKEGESFEYGPDGKPAWTDMIIGESAGTWAMWINTWKLGPSLTDATVSFARYNEQQHAAIDLWNDESIITSDHAVPQRAALNATEITEFASKVTDITSYASTTILQFITGELDLSDANWQAYIDRCNELGLSDYIAACQNAYDEYVAGLR